ncbi:ArsR/SmtB family transcription factor [Algoriphagus yeomjeoni]|uniref:ArsR/SmtB family transcription factor n=1 Tax=Algoriphagus yeomjeoni TaxID=291403 RepID=UPI003CE491AC
MKTRRDVFQAIADPTRRAIILLLAVGAMTPNALADHFNSSRQAVSKHLQILMECELAHQEQQGREIKYHLNADKMRDIEKWLEQFKQLLTQRFDQLDTVLEQLKSKRK